jgi:hypothetical protein
MIRITIAVLIAAACLASNAEARQRHKPAGLHPSCNILWPCAPVTASSPEQVRVARGRYVARSMGFGAAIEKPVRKVRRSARRDSVSPVRSVSATIVSHPAGCPARSFCGCGAAVRVFGQARRDLWLAANWLRFPRTSPAPGMVAARRGHVFVLERHLGGSTWLAYDANSGRHQTRIHPRSIAGFAIVNPRA